MAGAFMEVVNPSRFKSSRENMCLRIYTAFFVVFSSITKLSILDRDILSQQPKSVKRFSTDGKMHMLHQPQHEMRQPTQGKERKPRNTNLDKV